jgi:CRISPR associated protein Cas1
MSNPLSNARPLYLQSGTAMRLDIDAAQRLRIARKDHPEKRIPLHHVSRIVCNSTLDISATALMACMRGGIPVCIVNADGTALGWCLGARRKETSLAQLLIHGLDDPVWPVHYGEWIQNQKLAIAAQVLVFCGVPATPQARQNPRAALCNAHRQKHQQPCANHLNALVTLAKAELAAHLARESNDPQLLAWHRPGLNLLQDLGDLLGIHAHTDLHHAPLLPAQDQISQWAIKNYEKHSAHWQQRIVHLNYAFEQFLRRFWQ